MSKDKEQQSAEVIQLSERRETQTDDKTRYDVEKPPLLAPGKYTFALAEVWKGYLFKRAPKLMLTFRVMDEGPYFGKRLLRCYNVAGFSNKKEIRLKGWSGDLCREYSRLFGTPRRLKEIGTRAYKNKILLGTVRTVDRDRKQRPLPKGLEYSVIDELLEVVAG